MDVKEISNPLCIEPDEISNSGNGAYWVESEEMAPSASVQAWPFDG